METLTSANNDTDNRIIYEDEVCIITEHVNYIKVFFIKERIYLEDLDIFDEKIVNFLKENQFEKFLIIDCKNIELFRDEIMGRIIQIQCMMYESKKEKIIMFNLKPYLREAFRMMGDDRILSIYSTFDEAIEYINKRS
jgi:hypothetical protein